MVSGKERGAYYIEMYKERFREKLGFLPFPGTLNLECDTKELDSLKSRLIIVEGFKHDNRSYGIVSCFEVFINNVKGAIIVPEKVGHGEEIAEIIAPVNLREKFKLKDGDYVELKVR